MITKREVIEIIANSYHIAAIENGEYTYEYMFDSIMNDGRFGGCPKSGCAHDRCSMCWSVLLKRIVGDKKIYDDTDFIKF